MHRTVQSRKPKGSYQWVSVRAHIRRQEVLVQFLKSIAPVKVKKMLNFKIFPFVCFKQHHPDFFLKSLSSKCSSASIKICPWSRLLSLGRSRVLCSLYPTVHHCGCHSVLHSVHLIKKPLPIQCCSNLHSCRFLV